MVSCDDNNPCTVNDIQTILDSDGTICIPCAGTSQDCSTGTTSIQPCDDGNIFTVNDQETVLNCDGSTCIPCVGTPVDCSNGTTTVVSCDDRNPCTTNDEQTLLDVDDSVCIPCLGTPTENEEPVVQGFIICQNEIIPPIEVTNFAIGASLLWFETDPLLGGIPIFSGTNNQFRPNIDSSQVGTQTYWVLQKIEDCESTPASFQLTVESNPIVDAGEDILFDCETGEVMLNGSVPLDLSLIHISEPTRPY